MGNAMERQKDGIDNTNDIFRGEDIEVDVAKIFVHTGIKIHL